MTDEQLIAQIREETDLAKVDDEREDDRATRDYLIECCRANVEEFTHPLLVCFNGFQERANEMASDVEQYEQKIKRIEPFIAALDEQAEKLRKKKT